MIVVAVVNIGAKLFLGIFSDGLERSERGL